MTAGQQVRARVPLSMAVEITCECGAKLSAGVRIPRYRTVPPGTVHDVELELEYDGLKIARHLASPEHKP